MTGSQLSSVHSIFVGIPTIVGGEYDHTRRLGSPQALAVRDLLANDDTGDHDGRAGSRATRSPTTRASPRAVRTLERTPRPKNETPVTAF